MADPTGDQTDAQPDATLAPDVPAPVPPARRRRPAARWVIAAVVVAFAYLATLLLYAASGQNQDFAGGETPAAGVGVTIAIRDLDAAANLVTADVSINPGAQLLNPDEITPAVDVSLVLAPASGGQQLNFPKGEVPAVVPVRIMTEGDIESWPLDSYESVMVVQALTGTGPGRTQVPATVSIQSDSNGWKTWVESPSAAVADAESGLQVFTIRAKRAGGTLAFGVIMLIVLMTMPVLAGFVAYQTYRDRRRFEPSLASWIAAMLFATIPLRNFLPGAPPAGSWIDATVTLWVVVALVGSLAVYVAAWWRRSGLPT